MELFQSKDRHNEVKNSYTLNKNTPLGLIKLDLKINNQWLSQLPVEKKYFQLANDSHVITHVHSDYIVEYAFCKLDNSLLLSHLPVDEHYGVVWRVKSLVNGLKCEFVTTLNPINCNEIDGGIASGEALEAMEWEYDDYKLSLGTQDGVELVKRSKQHDWMPDRFYAEDDIAQHGIVQYISNGFVVPIPPLFENEICQVHFVIASKKCEDDDIATWYAVDLNTKAILDKVGLY